MQHTIKKSSWNQRGFTDLSILEQKFLFKGKGNVFKGTNRIRRKNALLTEAEWRSLSETQDCVDLSRKKQNLASKIIANCFTCFPLRFKNFLESLFLLVINLTCMCHYTRNDWLCQMGPFPEALISYPQFPVIKRKQRRVFCSENSLYFVIKYKIQC